MARWMALVVVCSACGTPSEWVDVTMDDGKFVIRTEAEGVDLRCFVDTGSARSWVGSDVPLYKHPRLDIGGWKLKIDADSSDDIDGHLASMTIDGESPNCWLGWDVLADVAFTVDYARSRIRIGPSGPDSARIDDADLAEPIEVDLTNVATVPVMDAMAQDVPVALIADLGSDVGMIRPEVIAEMADPPRTLPTRVTTAEGRVDVEVGLLDELEFGGQVDENVEFIVYDSPAVASLGDDLDGVIGGSTLRRYAVTFDGREGRLTLQAEAD